MPRRETIMELNILKHYGVALRLAHSGEGIGPPPWNEIRSRPFQL